MKPYTKYSGVIQRKINETFKNFDVVITAHCHFVNGKYDYDLGWKIDEITIRPPADDTIFSPVVKELYENLDQGMWYEQIEQEFIQPVTYRDFDNTDVLVPTEALIEICGKVYKITCNIHCDKYDGELILYPHEKLDINIYEQSSYSPCEFVVCKDDYMTVTLLEQVDFDNIYDYLLVHPLK